MGANATTFVPAYVSGEVLTAADLTVTNSGIPVFADSTARTAAFGGTGEKVLAEGQYAYLESDNSTSVWDGAAWQSVGVAPGLVYITGASFTSATTISMAAGVFTSTYKTYQIVFTATAAAGDGQFSARINVAGTPITAANYFGNSSRFPYSGTSPETSVSSSATSINIGAFTSTFGILPQYTFTVNEPTNASLKTQFYATGTGVNNANATAVIFAGGAYNVANATDGLTWIAGQAITGYYRVYGLSES
jgi:hypothetical protein